MPEYFHFKKFSLLQPEKGLRITTDSILCGAWADFAEDTNILDIGGGCGIIALMAAQKSKAIVQAIEVLPESVKICQQNFAESPWSMRLSCTHSSLQCYKPSDTFSHIISNPPFYTHSLPAKDIALNITKHADFSLPVEDIFLFASTYLQENGRLTLIYPAEKETNLLTNALFFKLYPIRICKVSSRKNSSPNRILATFSKNNVQLLSEELYIKNENNTYSELFIRLTKDFYTFMPS